MSEKTAISWTDATFNPWWGCQKVSPACDHCYAERDAKRFASGRVLWGVGAERRTFGDKHWEAPGKWAKTMPAKLGRRPRVFCASMGDWLDLDAPLGEFVRLLDTIRLTPELDWLLLTKRIGNWRKRMKEALDYLSVVSAPYASLIDWIQDWLDGDSPANVVMMATVIDQHEADRDITKLLAVPARRRGLSIEPMLGPVEVFSSMTGELLHTSGNEYDPGSIDWVICGGESGPRARPAHPDWFRSLRDQCAAAGVPFHFKQHGEWVGAGGQPNRLPHAWLTLDGAAHPYEAGATYHPPLNRPWAAEDPETLAFMAKVGKAAAGRAIDGVEHNGFPL